MGKQKILSVLLLVFFVMSLTAASVSACSDEDDHKCDCKEHNNDHNDCDYKCYDDDKCDCYNDDYKDDCGCYDDDYKGDCDCYDDKEYDYDKYW